MKRETRIIIAGVVTCAAFVVFTTTIVRGFVRPPNIEEESVVLPRGTATTSGGAVSSIQNTTSKPVRLIIPTIDVDAEIDDVGVAKSGRMAVPQSYFKVGWYRYGPTPGSRGSAVIAGHVDNGFGLNAVFARLLELKVGDTVSVLGEDGTTTHFAVTKIESYELADVPLKEIFNNKDGIKLNLITCDGKWDPEAKMYNRRVVVFTERI